MRTCVWVNKSISRCLTLAGKSRRQWRLGRSQRWQIQTPPGGHHYTLGPLFILFTASAHAKQISCHTPHISQKQKNQNIFTENFYGQWTRTMVVGRKWFAHMYRCARRSFGWCVRKVRTYQLDTSSVVFSGGKVARLIANGLLMYALVRYRNFCINFYVAKNI